MTIKDPVCGKTVWVPDVLLQVEYGGREYFFCAERCVQRFVEAPEKYAQSCAPEDAVTPSSEGT